jgi:hypothetical protein
MKKTKETVAYFGFGTNRDLSMMQHMIGRKKIRGQHGQLPGYEITIQRADQFRTQKLPTSPLPNKSPRDLIMNTWGPGFEMYTSRPNPTGVAYGTIWYVTHEELELVREWEIVDYGCQEDAYGVAITDEGEKVEVITQSFLRPAEIDRVVVGDDYEPYIWDKREMLKMADKLRLEYLERKRKGLK